MSMSKEEFEKNGKKAYRWEIMRDPKTGKPVIDPRTGKPAKVKVRL